MAYTITNQEAGITPIANTDAGVTFPNASSASPTPPNALGKIVKATDPTYGEGEFIFLKGVASCAVGSLVYYDGTTYQSALSVIATLANSARPVAVAMAATTAALWGWFQIGGTAVVKKGAIAIPATTTLGVGTAGTIAASASGKQVMGARTANAATVASATATIAVVIQRPHMQGRVT